MNALSVSHKLRIVPGPQSWYRKLPILGPVLDNALEWFRHQGYATSTMPSRLSRISHLIRWLQRQRGPILQGLTQQDLCSAYENFRIRSPEVASTTRALARFFREGQLIPEGKPAPPPASECELKAYGTYLRQIRGLADSTIAAQQSHLRFFLKFLAYDRHPNVIRTLRIEKIENFLRQRARTNNRFTLQHVVAALRSFLQHQHAQGALRPPLHQQIDTPRAYRLEQLPRALPWEQVVTLLRSIDCTQPDGLRDFTLLYLAARYGLRSGELVRLTLDDIDWRTGILKIQQTKTKHTLQLPLTDEAGDILARYLKTARPPCSWHEVFLRRTAPIGPLTRTAVYDTLQDRIRRSGLQLPQIGTHSLRHSLAAHLLRRGVALETISGVLGHQAPESTSVYLRLAVEDLREVALPVPRNGAPGSLKWKERKKTLPRVRPASAKPLVKAGFHSGLAASLRQYLATGRALGRGYANEEAVLRRWDHFVEHKFGRARQIRCEMFHDWALTMPQLTPTVRRQRLRIVRKFLLFHARNHPRTYIPELAILPKPSPHRPPRLVSPKEMACVLAAARHLPISPHNPLRAQTIRLALLLLFCCGLRRGELLRLQWSHFDTQENMLRIEATKFHKFRWVPVSKSVAQELRKYGALRRQRNLAVKPEDHLIWSDNPLAAKPVYSAPALANNWQQLCLASGVLDERGRPPRIHDLRHSAAVAVLERWYRTGADLHAKLPHLATYLGHVNPVSTHHYLHLTSELQQAANQRFHDYAFRTLTPGGVS